MDPLYDMATRLHAERLATAEHHRLVRRLQPQIRWPLGRDDRRGEAHRRPGRPTRPPAPAAATI